MITIKELIDLADVAYHMGADSNPLYPPSVYYRYLGLLLQKLDGKLAVECGTAGGGASRQMAEMNPQATIVSIDMGKLPQVQWIEDRYPNFKFILGDSCASAARIAEQYGSPSLVFVDTDHTYAQTLREYNTWKPLMKPGSVICFDDLNRDAYDGGVAKFYRELQGNKTPFHALRLMHLGGSPTDGGFGCLILD